MKKGAMDNKKNSVVNEKGGTSEQDARYFLAAIVESSQDSIVTIDLNRIITTWNKAAEHLYGYEADEVIGKPLGGNAHVSAYHLKSSVLGGRFCDVVPTPSIMFLGYRTYYLPAGKRLRKHT